MGGFLKPIDQTQLDPSYFKVWRAYEGIMPSITANNATFGGAGAMLGQASLSTTTSEILTKNKVYKYSANGVNGQNDFFAFQTTFTGNSFKNNTRTLQFKLQTVNAIDSDVSAHVKIVGGTRDGYVYSKLLKAASAGAINSLAFDVPSDATSLIYGFKNNSTTTTLQFFVDDISLGYKAFDYINNVSQQGSFQKWGDGSVSMGSYFFLFSNITNSGSEIYTISTVSSHTRFTFLKKATVNASFSMALTPNAGTPEIYKNGVQLAPGTTNSSGNYSHASANVIVDVGDYIEFYYGQVATTNTSKGFTLNAEAVSDAILQSWADGTEWKALTYTEVNALTGNQGLGTFTAGGVEWMKGKDGLLHYKGKLAVGTPSASEARIPYPAGLIAADTTKIPSIQLGGLVIQAANGAFSYNTLVEPSMGYFTIGYQASGSSALTKATGSGVFSVGAVISFNFTVPIAGWSSLPTIVSLPISAQQDYFIEAAGNAGQAITANVTDIPFIATTQNNLTWDGSGFTAPISGNYEVVGSCYTSTISSPVFYACINTVQTKLIGFQVGSTGIINLAGKVYLTAGQRFSLRCDTGFTCQNNAIRHTLSITRLNGKNDSVCVGEVAKNLIANVQYRGNGTRTTLSSTPVAVPLTTVKGDTQIVSIAVNQFTLKAGEYEISWQLTIAIDAATNASSKIYNVTDDSDVEYASILYLLNSMANQNGTTKINIASQKTFELRAYSAGTAYIGQNGNTAPNDLNGSIKITKILGV
jgi:hypothetical protein